MRVNLNSQETKEIRRFEQSPNFDKLKHGEANKKFTFFLIIRKLKSLK